jgi:hypothetical protein
MSGFREQELQYFTWKEIGASTVSVRHKPTFGWTPKSYKERSVPVPAAFLKELLASRPADAKPGDLVFPAPEGGPDGHMLRPGRVVAAQIQKHHGYEMFAIWD